jgi:hypothetical protein
MPLYRVGSGRAALNNPASASSGYTTTAVSFDGTNDYMTGTSNTDLTGSVDGKKGIVSFWFNMKGNDGAYQILFEPSSQQGLGIQRTNGSKWEVTAYTSGLGFASDQVTSSSYNTSTNTGWHHLLASWNTTSGVATHALYVDDASNRGAQTLNTDAIADYATANTIGIGARVGPSLLCFLDIADFYINYDEYLDITDSANRRKFITAGLKPVDLGLTGSAPTGTAPIGLFRASPAHGEVVTDWHKNKGTGGDIFTLTGTLSAAASNPSD